MQRPELNEPQATAVAHSVGPLLIFAGAGSGKTRTITYRVARLIAEHRVPPYRLLAVTFTNKAAGEMRARLETLIGALVVRDLWVGTFHATCARLLRRYHAEAGLTEKFVIYDDSDQRAVLARIMKERGIDERVLPPKMVLARIHAQKREGRTPEQARRSVGFDAAHSELYERYQSALRQSNAVDFEDLILEVMRLAENEQSSAGEALRRQFDHLLVDEFQDTNITQYRLLVALSGRTRNLCVVGDDDQAIYRWRGADVRIIRNFRRDFPDATVVKLEQNYRSTANIVAAGLGVIQPSVDREPKRLWTEAPPGDRVRIRAVADEREEAAHVVHCVERLIGGGLDPRQIAVFYRVHAQSRVLEEGFRAGRIPYQIIGGMKFFERAEVKDLLAYLRLVENPRSDADLLRIVNVPARGIGTTTIERLLEAASSRAMCAYDAIAPAISEGRLGSAAQRKLQAFKELMEGLRARAESLGPHALADEVLEQTGYRRALREADSAESDARLENIEELLGSIAEYEEELMLVSGAATIGGYLERISLYTASDAMKDVPSVALMTVHAAKGLEFDSVLLTGMEEEIFPYLRLGSYEIEDVDEERRLAYVAITRARRQLVITHAAARTLFGQTRYLEPSRFLRDIPSEVVVREGLVREGLAGANASLGRPWSASTRNHGAAKSAPGAPRRVVDTRDAHPIPDDEPGVVVREGDRVRHKRFGNGIVERVETGSSLTIVARFPGWGQKRILAEFLERG
jgi:DNA helicase-2/ATP-dependent DNA helicase PcrA